MSSVVFEAGLMWTVHQISIDLRTPKCGSVCREVLNTQCIYRVIFVILLLYLIISSAIIHGSSDAHTKSECSRIYRNLFLNFLNQFVFFCPIDLYIFRIFVFPPYSGFFLFCSYFSEFPEFSLNYLFWPFQLCHLTFSFLLSFLLFFHKI